MSLLQRLIDGRVASRVWRRESAVFAPAPAGAAVHEAVLNRLGWLGAPEAMAAELPALHDFADRARHDGLTDIRLLGMGGSSVCAEVLRETAPAAPDRPSLAVLDTTDERAFVLVETGEASGDLDRAARAFEAAGHPVFRVEADSGGLGAEFFRWEFATAVAGAALGINPFDEPNVREAKTRMQSLLDAFHFDDPAADAATAVEHVLGRRASL